MLDYLCDGLCGALHGHPRATSPTPASPGPIDPQLVRGLDYYTRTTFEFVHDGLGAQSGIGGGGRYDGLMQSLGGQELSGIGFGARHSTGPCSRCRPRRSARAGAHGATCTSFRSASRPARSARRLARARYRLRRSGIRTDMALRRPERSRAQ